MVILKSHFFQEVNLKNFKKEIVKIYSIVNIIKFYLSIIISKFKIIVKMIVNNQIIKINIEKIIKNKLTKKLKKIK